MEQSLRDQILRHLEKHGVPYEHIYHEAVYTCEAAEKLELPARAASVKNLLLRDEKGKNFYLLLLEAHERVDFKKVRTQTGKRLSFARASELQAYLGIEAGAVSPLCLLAETAREISLLVSQSLLACDEWCMHPGVCTETLIVPYRQLAACLPQWYSYSTIK